MKILTKFDYLLVIAVVIISFGFNFYLTSKLKEPVTNGNAVVYYKNEIYGTYDLSEEQTINIKTDEGSNTIDIHDGIVDMTDADCKDQYCVKDRPIHYNNQSIVCLPHQLLVKIESEQESEIDSFVR